MVTFLEQGPGPTGHGHSSLEGTEAVPVAAGLLPRAVGATPQLNTPLQRDLSAGRTASTGVPHACPQPPMPKGGEGTVASGTRGFSEPQCAVHGAHSTRRRQAPRLPQQFIWGQRARGRGRQGRREGEVSLHTLVGHTAGTAGLGSRPTPSGSQPLLRASGPSAH